MATYSGKNRFTMVFRQDAVILEGRQIVNSITVIPILSK
ncbi:hypothetical protein LLB_2161 [Legionella longbeachae D-4968]|nr:hypothetical protein LLB_2161 [Legionella longbeachae D-4968]